MFVYLMASAASVFDIVVVVVGATDDDTKLGYPDNLLKIRLTFGMILAATVQCLVVWRFLRLWRRMTYVAAVTWFTVACVAAYGLTVAYWRGSGSLGFVYGIYGKIRISFMATLGGVIAGRTYYLSRHLKKLYGPHFRPRAYTCLGAFVDGGFTYTIFLLIYLQLRFRTIRTLLPQMAGLSSTFILYQEIVGRAACDIEFMTDEIMERTNATTPVLDSVFSTPGASLQVLGGPRTINGPDLSFIDSESNYGSRRGDRDNGLLGAVGKKDGGSRSVISVITGRLE